VVVKGNPMDDISATEHPELVMRGGRIYLETMGSE